MTLNSLDLLITYGLRLAALEGTLDQPARKNVIDNVLSVYGQTINYDSQKITVHLLKNCTDNAEIKTIADAIYNLMTSYNICTVVIPEHSMAQFSATARDGARVEITKTVIEITIPFTKITV